MQSLDPQSVPLKSINLIEASAGTGKSWTVTLLYLRLILESNLTVDQILVVTFTDAATKELRDAVRNRLLEALFVFEASECDVSEKYKKRQELLVEKPEYQQLLDNYASDQTVLEESINKLKRAKLSIDEAAIFTIHSFCQRALTEYAFEASLDFESELMDDDRELMQKLADNFWRRNFHKAPRVLIHKLQQKQITPDVLLDDVWKYVGKPYLEIKGPSSEELKDHEWQDLETAFKKAKTTWQENFSEITQLLLDHGGLNKSIYSEAKLLTLCQTMCDCEASLAHFVESGKGLERLGETALTQKTNKGFEPPTHPFFSQWQVFLDSWQSINSRTDDYINSIRIDLLKYLQRELPNEKKRFGVLAYDDLLLQLQAALKTNNELANNLSEKYRAALIDEFQDTDPVQFDIFSRIFHKTISGNNSEKNVVFLVGDPKQAIYSFRGGDVNTYLKAKEIIPKENRYTIKTNYRSHPKLIEAYNTLYTQCENSFQDQGIAYTQIIAGKENLVGLEGLGQGSFLQFWQCYQEKGEKAEPRKKRIATAVSGDITSLLNQETLIEGRHVSGGDFAILVRSHAEGSIIKQALAQRGIASIQSSKKTIFETHEANEILSLLSAIVDPQREDSIRRAIVTELVGKTVDDLLSFESNTKLWEEQLVNFQTWHFHWKKQGFLSMMRQLMGVLEMHQNLLGYPDGERRLTNVLHLSELIHRVTRQQSLSMEEVLRWIKKQQQVASNKEGELRLESDENLVKIVTIHKSKGLEYPIVYCPFVALSGKNFTDKVYAYHEGKTSFLEIGSEKADEHKGLKQQELNAEDTRLLYVALTRAKYRCTVVCFPEKVPYNKDTALGWLITNGKLLRDNKDFYDTYRLNLNQLVSKSKGSVGLIDLPEFDAKLTYQNNQVSQTLTARTFGAEIRTQAQVTSFSGLTAGSHDSKFEAPDHDAQVVASAITTPKENEFPRGATAGTALHEIYENLDFELPIDEQQELITNSLNKWGFDNKHTDAANTLMENSLRAEIFDGFSLNQLSNDKRLDEMEFYLPLEKLSIDALKQILFQHLPQDWQVVRDAVETLNFDEVEGYLKGYIDLIFEHQDKYYIVDYKSNSLEDYSSELLLPVMADSHYYLQYLLYSVALHRYLQKRLVDYSWETHMGGTYYLFIRGMNETGKKGGSTSTPLSRTMLFNGIFHNKPSVELINALDALFMKSFL